MASVAKKGGAERGASGEEHLMRVDKVPVDGSDWTRVKSKSAR